MRRRKADWAELPELRIEIDGTYCLVAGLPTRNAVYMVIAFSKGKPVSLSDISKILHKPPSQIFFHLRRLQRENIIIAQKGTNGDPEYTPLPAAHNPVLLDTILKHFQAIANILHKDMVVNCSSDRCKKFRDDCENCKTEATYQATVSYLELQSSLLATKIPL